jgi:hypothetical protein
MRETDVTRLTHFHCGAGVKCKHAVTTSRLYRFSKQEIQSVPVTQEKWSWFRLTSSNSFRRKELQNDRQEHDGGRSSRERCGDG